MPPQGESTGFAIEDAVLLARVVEKFPENSAEDIFKCYERARRARIDKGWKIANMRVEHLKDKNWWTQMIIEWFAWFILWLAHNRWVGSTTYDVREEKLII